MMMVQWGAAFAYNTKNRESLSFPSCYLTSNARACMSAALSPTMTTALSAPQKVLPPHVPAFPYDMPDLERVPGALTGRSSGDVHAKLAHIRELWPKLQSLHDLNIEYAQWLEQQQMMETRVQEYSESAKRRLHFIEDEISQEEARFLQEMRAVTRLLEDPLGASAVAQNELKHVVELFGHIQRRIVQATRLAQTTVSLARIDLAADVDEADKRYVSTAFVREIQLLLTQRKEREEAAVKAHESYAKLMAGYEYIKLRRQAKAASGTPAPPLLPAQYLASNLVKQEEEEEDAESSQSVKTEQQPEDTFDVSVGDDLQKSVSLAQQRSQILQKEVYEIDDRLRQVTLKYRMAAMRTLTTMIQQQLRQLQDRIEDQSSRVRAAFRHVIQQYTNSAAEIAGICEQFQESAASELESKLAEYAEVERLLSERSDLLHAMDNNWPSTMTVDFGARLTEKLDAMAIQQGFGSYHMSLRPSQAELNTLQSEVFRTAGGFIKRAFQRIHKPLASFELPFRGLCTVGATGSAKCWGRGTKLLMFDGTAKTVEEIVRDSKASQQQVLLGDDSTPRIVKFGSEIEGAVDGGKAKMYKVTSNNEGRTSWTCNAGHILVLKCNVKPSAVRIRRDGREARYIFETYEQRIANGPVVLAKHTFQTAEEASRQREAAHAAFEPLVVEMTVTAFLSSNAKFRRNAQMFQPSAVQFAPPTKSLKDRLKDIFKNRLEDSAISDDLVLHTSWCIGVWLADGCKNTRTICQIEDDIHHPGRSHKPVVDRLFQWCEITSDNPLSEYEPLDRSKYVQRHGRLTSSGNVSFTVKMTQAFRTILKTYGDDFYTTKNFSVANDLLRETEAVRQQLLAGIIDGDGHASPDGTYQLACKDREKMLHPVKQLARSLGFRTGKVGETSCHDKCTGKVHKGWRLYISGQLDRIKTTLPWKQYESPEVTHRFPNKDHRCDGFQIKDIGEAEYFGFSLTGNGRCLLDDFVVTHNTTSLLENFWSTFDAAIAGKTTAGQRWMLVGLPSFLQANEWLNSINASRDLKYSKIDTSAKRYTKLGPNTTVLTVPLPGVVLGADDWDHPDAIKLVFQVMSGSLPTENRRVNLARRWAEMAKPGQTWFDRFRNGKEMGLKQRSLEVDYEKDEVYASLSSKERAELNNFQKQARDRLLGGMRRTAGRQNEMRRASAVDVIGQLGICLPPGGHAIFDEAHLLIDPRRPTATENTKVFHWNVAIENSDDERIWTMTGTPGNTLIDMSNLINKHRKREDERVLSTRMRESAPKRPEKGSDDERRKDLYAKATRCEEMYLQNKYFAYDAAGRPVWQDGMEYKYTLLHVGYISYITIQHDLTIYPQISSEFPQLKELEVRGAAAGSTPLPESFRLELQRERPTELYFDAQKRALQRVDSSLVLPYNEDDKTALEAQDLGHFRPLEVLVPLNDEAEAELRKKMAEDVSDKTRARYRGSSACQEKVPTERYRGETDVEFAARQWLHSAECMDYVHPDLKSGMRRDPGLMPYRNAIPNKILVLQSLAVMFADLGRKVFLFAMLDSKYAAYAIEPTVKTFLCNKHPQSLKTFVPFELVNAASLGGFITQHAGLIRKHAEKQSDRIKDWARAVSDAWYQHVQDSSPLKDAGHKPRLIMFKSIKASKSGGAEEDGASSSSSGANEETEAESVKSAKLDATDQALINETLRLIYTDRRNEQGHFVRWFVGDANSNTGLNLSGTEVAILAEPIDTSSQQQAFARAFRFIVSQRQWKVLCIVLKSVFQQYSPGDELAEELLRKDGKDVLQLSAARPDTAEAATSASASASKKKKKAAPKSLSVDDIVKRGRGALHTPDQILSHRRQLRVTDLALVSWQRAAIDCLFFGEYSKVPGGCFPEMAQRLKAKKADGYCLAEGTRVTLATGVSVNIEDMPKSASEVLSFHEEMDGGGAVIRKTISPFRFDQGVKPCVELTLEDGRTLKCTPDHRIATLRGMAEVKDLKADDRIVVVPEGPATMPLSKKAIETTWSVKLANDNILCIGFPNDRSRILAFARIMGYAMTDGSLQSNGTGFFEMGHQLDAQSMISDIMLVCNSVTKPLVHSPHKGHNSNTFKIAIPRDLGRSLIMHGVKVGKKLGQDQHFPEVVLSPSTPTVFVQEFLGGLFGGDGGTTNLENGHFSSVQFFTSAPSEAEAPTAQRILEEGLGTILQTRFGITCAGVSVKKAQSELSSEGLHQVILRIGSLNTLRFAETIGFRHCAHKAQKLAVAASWYRGCTTRIQQRIKHLEFARRFRAEGYSYPKTSKEAMKLLAATCTTLITEPSAENVKNAINGRIQLERAAHMCFMPANKFIDHVGARECFTREAGSGQAYGVKRERNSLPYFHLGIAGVRNAGSLRTFDLSVDDTHLFVGNGVVVHNCYLRAPDGGPAADASGTPYLRIHSQALLGALQRRVKMPSAKAEGFGDLCHQLNGVLALTNNYTVFDAMLYIALQRPEYGSIDTTTAGSEDVSGDEEDGEEEEDEEENEDEEQQQVEEPKAGERADQSKVAVEEAENNSDDGSGEESGEDEEGDESDEAAESEEEEETKVEEAQVPEPAAAEDSSSSSDPAPSGGGIINWMKSLAGSGWRTAKSAVGIRSRAGTESASLHSLAFMEQLLQQTGSETAELPSPEEFLVLLPGDRLLLRGILHLKREEMKDRPSDRDLIEKQATEHMVTSQRKADRVRIKKEIRNLLQSEESLAALEEQILSKSEQLSAKERATKMNTSQQHLLASVAGTAPVDATDSGVLTREIDTYLSDLFAKKLPQQRPFLPTASDQPVNPSSASAPWSFKSLFSKQ
jgi:hypothetical protein